VAEAIGRDGSRGGTGSNGRPSVPGEIRSPEDVVAAIDRICDYYARLEPSSPVPLLLRRAQRLVGKGFLDIVRDLSPEVVRQIEALGGITADGG
jgi:type VI secretion system protein ImpA